MGHPSGSYVTRKTKAWHVAQKLADIINTAGASVAGRFGPDQSGVIHAQAWASGPSTGGITHRRSCSPPGRRRGTGSSGIWTASSSRTAARWPASPVGSGQGFQWTGGQRGQPPVRRRRQRHEVPRHARLHAALTGQARRGGSDERLPEDVHGLRAAIRERRAGVAGRLLPHGGRGHRATRRGRWTTRRSSPAGGTSSATPTNEERILLLVRRSRDQITVAARVRSLDARLLAGGRADEEALAQSPASRRDVEWGATISNIAVTGDASLKVGGGSERIEEADARCKYTGFWEDYKYGAVGWPVAVVEQRAREAHRARERAGRPQGHAPVLVPRASTISTSGRSSTPTAARSASPWTAWRTDASIST